MDDPVRLFLEHPRRRWFAWGAAAAVLLVATLPAYDAYAAAGAEAAELAADLAVARSESAALPALRERLAAAKAAAAATNGGDGTTRGLDEAGAEAFREALVRRVAATGCRYRRLTLEPPRVAPWASGPAPLPGLAAGSVAAGSKTGEEPAFELVTRRLTAEAVGPAGSAAELLGWAAAAHPHAVPVSYELRFEEDPDPAARGVHLEFTLLLTAVRPAAKKAGA